MAKLFLPVPKIKSISLGGGGARGCVYGPALKALENQQVLEGIEDVLGVSAGAITASLLAIGTPPDEITKIAQETNFKSLLGNFNLFSGNRFGLYSTQELQKMADTKLLEQLQNRLNELEQLNEQAELSSKNKIKEAISQLRKEQHVTFAVLEQLRTLFIEAGQPNKIKTLSIVAAKAADGTPLLFSNKSMSTILLADAVAASSAIPPVFKSHEITINGESVALRDGGMHCSLLTPEYHLPQFASVTEKRLSSILLLLYPETDANQKLFNKTKQPNVFMLVIGYLLKLVFGANGVMAKFGMEEGAKEYGQNVIPMNVDISTNDFGVSVEKKIALGQKASDSVENYLQNYRKDAAYCIEGLSNAHCLYQTPTSQLDEAVMQLKNEGELKPEEIVLIDAVVAHRCLQQDELEGAILAKFITSDMDGLEALIAKYCEATELVTDESERSAILEVNRERLHNGVKPYLEHFFAQHDISKKTAPHLDKMKHDLEQPEATASAQKNL